MKFLHWALMLQVVLGAACFQPVPTDNSPCPCGAGFECCAGANVCRAVGQCGGDAGGGDAGSGGGTGGGGGASDGGGTGGGQGALVLGPLTIQTDGVAPVRALLRGLTTPAELAVSGESVFVLARQVATCVQQGGGPLAAAVTRLEVAGSWTSAWITPLPVDVVTFTLAVSGDIATAAGSGTLSGTASRGGVDAWVTQLRADGTVAWSRQFGSIFEDEALRVVPRPGGKVVVIGVTGGSLEGQVTQGGRDLFVTQLGADGSTEWFRQFGSTGNESFDDVETLEDGSLVLSGFTTGILEPGRVTAPTQPELFLRHLDSNGDVVWTTQHQLAEAAFTKGRLRRWGAGLAWGGTSETKALQLARFNSDGALNWTADAGDSVRDFEFAALDAGPLSVHGVRLLPDVLSAGELMETFETVWADDAGSTTTSGHAGGWPSQGTHVGYPAIGRTRDSWLVGGTLMGGVLNDVLSLTAFSPGSALRTAHHDWKFAGPEYITDSHISLTTADFISLQPLQSGATVAFGRTLFKECEQGSSAGWLWVMKVP